MVIGASAGPMVGELPIGISVLFSSAWAIPHSSRTADTEHYFFQHGRLKEGIPQYPLFLH